MCVAIAIAAVISGATVLEKHFTLSQKMYGSDALNSTEPDEFKKLVDEIRILESALSSKIDKDEKAKALRNMKITFEKSIVSSRPMSKLDILEFKDMTFKKPGDGIPAKDYRMLIGKKLKQSINKNHKFKWIDFE
jgi:sialic acid synthase SpsE